MSIEIITTADTIDAELLKKIEEATPKSDIFSVLVDEQLIKNE